MTDTEKHALQVQQAHRRAVAEALEKKRRLGQYAVIYKDGKSVRISPEEMNRKEDS